MPISMRCRDRYKFQGEALKRESPATPAGVGMFRRYRSGDVGLRPQSPANGRHPSGMRGDGKFGEHMQWPNVVALKELKWWGWVIVRFGVYSLLFTLLRVGND